MNVKNSIKKKKMSKMSSKKKKKDKKYMCIEKMKIGKYYSSSIQCLKLAKLSFIFYFTSRPSSLINVNNYLFNCFLCN